MILKSLYLKNFRAYRDIKIEFDKDLNVIIGQNDIGKSTILEALDIFFGGEVVKIDITDYNINAIDNKIIIGVEFEIEDDFELIIDTTNATLLKDEYLLNENNFLEIYKLYEVKDNKLKERVFIKANYPTCFDTPLINLKIDQLKNKLNEIKNSIENFDTINKSKSAEIRKALYDFYTKQNPELKATDIDLQKEEGKNIWRALQKELPLYFLFQNDRENKDSDGDIQNPLKSATKQIVASLEDEFERLKKKIEEHLISIGQDTIEKMKEMGLDIADTLKPVVKNKNWDSLFSFSLESDDGIALNKRGSGVRRMVLLNYFRAEAERQANGNKSIIYAFEEPETAQHPNNQKLLMEAFIKLSTKSNYQILLTTHTPEIAKMVKTDQLIFIEKDHSGRPYIVTDNNSKLEKISKTLGILPYYKNKIVVCVEGNFDVQFLTNINKIPEFQKIVNLEEIDIIPLNGSNLKQWVQNHYLKDSNVIEVHIYDSDLNSGKSTLQYKKPCEKINKRNDKSYCFLTKKREMENYIHWQLIEQEFEINCDEIKEKWDESDITKFLVNNNPKLKENHIKNILNGKLSKQMTKELLEDINGFDEIETWFKKIEELINHT